MAAMEIVEEGNNQPKITPKRIKVEENVEEEEEGEDRISALPDCVLLEILSRLPSTKSAIRTGTLSKRWKYLWTSVPTLIFYHSPNNPPLSEFVSLVDKTLTQRRQLKLRKFKVCIRYDIPFESQVNNWIRYAISCNVEQLHLRLWDLDYDELEISSNDYFFSSSCFTDLKLSGCILDPTGTISWKRLRSLYIRHGYLDEDLIKNILSGSPLLETLVLKNCYGYRRLDIISKSVKKVVLCGYLDPDEESRDLIEINAPNILSLTIEDNLFLCKILLLNVSSLVEVNLDYKWFERWGIPYEKAEDLIGLIQSLHHVKELKIGSCFQVIDDLKAIGFIFPSNVKFPDVP